MLTREQVLELGFKELPHLNILNSLVFDIGRKRQLSIGCLGTPNEVMYINYTNPKEINDLVCIWNYDYDGYLTLEKISVLLSFFAKIKLKNETTNRDRL